MLEHLVPTRLDRSRVPATPATPVPASTAMMWTNALLGPTAAATTRRAPTPTEATTVCATPVTLATVSPTATTWMSVLQARTTVMLERRVPTRLDRSRVHATPVTPVTASTAMMWTNALLGRTAAATTRHAPTPTEATTVR